MQFESVFIIIYQTMNHTNLHAITITMITNSTFAKNNDCDSCKVESSQVNVYFYAFA